MTVSKPVIIPYPPMLPHLHRLIASGELLSLWEDEATWRGLCIDYHPPRVERLYTDTERWRVMLHRIHPCPAHTSLWHSHPWPSAVKLLGGHDGERVTGCVYDHGVGFIGRDGLHCVSREMLHEGDCYEITDPLAWHYVRPVDAPVYSVMIAGHPWAKHTALTPVPQRELTANEVEDIRSVFGDLLAWKRNTASH